MGSGERTHLTRGERTIQILARLGVGRLVIDSFWMSWAFSTGESDAIVNKALMRKSRYWGKEKTGATEGVIWRKSQCFVMSSHVDRMKNWSFQRTPIYTFEG
jgi:hypothetical protein